MFLSVIKSDVSCVQVCITCHYLCVCRHTHTHVEKEREREIHQFISRFVQRFVYPVFFSSLSSHLLEKTVRHNKILFLSILAACIKRVCFVVCCAARYTRCCGRAYAILCLNVEFVFHIFRDFNTSNVLLQQLLMNVRKNRISFEEDSHSCTGTGTHTRVYLRSIGLIIWWHEIASSCENIRYCRPIVGEVLTTPSYCTRIRRCTHSLTTFPLIEIYSFKYWFNILPHASFSATTFLCSHFFSHIAHSLTRRHTSHVP